MTITATCGHKITHDWWISDQSAILIKEYSRDGQAGMSYIVVCPDCRRGYEEEGLIIIDESKLEENV